MNYKLRKSGFSLTEVLLAVGALAIGMLFIAGVFPVGIHFTTIATERTIAAVAADEAFAKIRLYAVGDPNDENDDIKLEKLEYDKMKPDETTEVDVIFPAAKNAFDEDYLEFAYPSNEDSDSPPKQYCWSALCRLTEVYNPTSNPNPPVQVTVFVCRKPGANLKYHDRYDVFDGDLPVPVPVGVQRGGSGRKNELRITDDKTFINDGYTIVDDRTGRIYRILQRYKGDDDGTILLDRDWDEKWLDGEGKYITVGPDKVWVVPPPVGGGRYPCIAVYQKVIKF